MLLLCIIYLFIPYIFTIYYLYILHYYTPIIYSYIYSLNVANALAYSTFLEQGLTRLTPTHDLNSEQIISMQNILYTSNSIEVIIHQHLPIFHTEHCIFCRFLSAGNNSTYTITNY